MLRVRGLLRARAAAVVRAVPLHTHPGTVQYSTVQYIALQYSIVQYSTQAQCSFVDASTKTIQILFTTHWTVKEIDE